MGWQANLPAVDLGGRAVAISLGMADYLGSYRSCALLVRGVGRSRGGPRACG